MIRPRREEVTEIVGLLDSGKYETPEALATEILKRTYTLFQKRDTYLWAHRDGGLLLLYGPFAQEREALKLATQAALGGENRVYRVLGPTPLSLRLSDSTSGTCTCGHLKGVHEHNKSGTCWAGQMSGKKWQRTCRCEQFKEAS